MISRIEELERLPGLAPTAVVVGSGYAGVELAATVAERLPSASVQIISSGAPCLPLNFVLSMAFCCIRIRAWTLQARLLARAHACALRCSDSRITATRQLVSCRSAVETCVHEAGDDILPGCPQGQREAASAILQRYGVSIVPNAKVRPSMPHSAAVLLAFWQGHACDPSHRYL